MNQESLALEAAEVLVAAYREGKRRGGHIEWSDLDVAHEIARHALVVARCSVRARRYATPSTRRFGAASLPILVPRVALVGDVPTPYGEAITRPEDVWNLFKVDALSWDRERFLTLALDPRKRLLGVEEVSVGTLTSSVVHPREIFKALILANAESFIGVHNHPSGDPSPSPEDLAVTRKLKEAGEILGIPLLDHVVLGHESFCALCTRPDF